MENQEKEIIEQEIETESEEQDNNTNIEVVENEEQAEEYTGKQVTTLIRYDYRTMKYFNMYNAVYRRKLPLLYTIFGIGTILLTIYSLGSSLYQASKNPDYSMTSTYFTTVIFLLFAAYFIKQALGFEKFVDKSITNHFANNKVAKQHIQIREDKITLIPLNKPEESFSYDWAQISSIEEIDEFFFLYVGRQPLIISKDSENIVEGTYEQMLEIFDEQIAVKPYKRCYKKVVKREVDYVHQDDLENDEHIIVVETTDEVEEDNINE